MDTGVVEMGGQQASNVRRKVMLGLFLLSVVTYLDRVCINSAAPEMQRDLGLSNTQWGMVVAAFLAAYGIFEVPVGWLGDRFGPRMILTRIVVWWSGFTALTGVTRTFGQLLVVRAMFGAGEAGAYPNASCVVSRWSPGPRLDRHGQPSGRSAVASTSLAFDRRLGVA